MRFGEKNFRGLASHADKVIRDANNLLDVEETTDAQMDFEIEEAIQEDHNSDTNSQAEYAASLHDAEG